MADSARFALHRPELRSSLTRGEAKIKALMVPSRRDLPARHLLIQANADHPWVYRMVSGWAARSRTLPDARDQCILVFLPGDLFAVKGMFVERHMDDVVILADSVVEQIHYRDLLNAYNSDPDVATRCTWQILEEERRLHSWVTGLGVGTAEERLALLLSDFQGRLALAGVIAPGALSFSMPLTQTQLGQHVGITAVHVNRVLKQFREEGIATVREGEVRIADRDRLAKLAFPLLDVYERQTPEYVGGLPE
ncbi:MAG TPA: Crp/Fnr family transcriptional regulator [Steroidobacteraceae bacterium]|jgi:CRP-like cAMP-binding protein